MPASTQPPAPLRIRVAPEEVTLRTWGLRDFGWYGWLSLLLAGLAAGAAAWATRSRLAGWGALAVLLLTMWRYWLPIRYHLGPQGITQSVLAHSSRIPWMAIHSYEIRTKGVMLYPDVVLTTLSPLRGMYLPWGTQKEQVLSHVDYYLAAWTRSERSTRREG